MPGPLLACHECDLLQPSRALARLGGDIAGAIRAP
jgi:hypothetical protein